MAVLESFASDDEMRDSAIFSDGEESAVTSPVLSKSANKPSRRKLRRSHTCKECNGKSKRLDKLVNMFYII